MSADNPTSTTADKPVPVAPAPAETNDGAGAYDPDLDDLADEALSETPINYDRDPAPASARGAGEGQGNAPSGSGGPDGQDGAGVTGVPGARDQGSHQVPDSEGMGSLEQSGSDPGFGVADGGEDAYDPDLDALADEALSEPPIDYNEDPAPMRGPAAAPVHDSDGGHGTEGPGAGESGTEPPASERPGRGNGQQDGQPAPVRASQDGDTEPRAEDDANGKPDSDPAAKADTPAPQPPGGDAGSPEASEQDPTRPADAAEPVSVPSPAASEPQPATERVPEPGSEEGTAEAAVPASPGDDIPAASPASTSGETSEEPQTLPAERSEPPVVPAAVEDTGSQEPQAVEEDPAVGQAEEPAEPQASEASPHLEGDEEEGSYGLVSWVTIPSDESESGDQASEDQALEESESEEPEEEEELEPEEAFQIARREALGMDPRPSGGELLEAEEKKTSKLEKLRRTAYESELIENTNDAAEEASDPLDKLFDRPAGPAHAEVSVPAHHDVYTPSAQDHGSVGDVVMAGVVLSYAGFEVGRFVARGVHNLTGRAHDLIGRQQDAGN